MEPTLEELATLKTMCISPEYRAQILREATLGNVPLAIMAAFAAGMFGAYRPEGEEPDSQTGLMYALGAAGLVLGGSYLYNARGIKNHCAEQRFTFNP